MKTSKYNITQATDKGFLVCNTKSSALILLNAEYERKYNFIVNNPNTLDFPDLKEMLITGEMLVDDSIDEFQELLVKSIDSRYESERLSLTIAPTLACNFCCPYCYEKGKEYTWMSEETIDNLVAFVKKFDDLKSLSISWYGGEPLLALKSIESITKKLKENINPNCQYFASIVSNGYLLNTTVAMKLKELGIVNVQITIDGSKEQHDMRRVLHDKTPTYDKIFQNIESICDILRVNIRTNVDKDNIDSAIKIFDSFDSYNLKNKVGFYLAPVSNTNDTCDDNICLNRFDFSDKEMDFYFLALQRGYNYIYLPKTNIGICGAVTKNSFVIDPKGDLYKCWNDIGDSDKCIGNIRSKVELSKQLTDWLLHNPIIDEECKNCDVFPMCFGGCPDQIMKKNKKACSTIKWNLYKRMELMSIAKKRV